MSFINIFKSISNFQFPYTLEDKPIYESSLWQVYNGTRKADSTPITAFKANINPQTQELIANAIHKARILKIPGLCKVLETFDSDPQSTFIITERVRPFPWDEVKDLQINKQGIELGVSQILTTLKFLNAFVLGSISKESLFIDSTGQWLIFGLEVCQKKTDVDPGRFSSNIQLYNRLMGLGTVTDEYQKIDSLRLAALISELFGGASSTPKDWQTLVQNLSRSRVNLDSFIDRIESSTTWLSNPLISIFQQLKELHIKDPQDKLVLMSQVQNVFFETRDSFHHLSPEFIDGLLLPELSNTIQWLTSNQVSDVSSTTRLIPFLAIFLDLTMDRDFLNETSKTLIYTCFSLPDRQIRFLLLIYLPKMAKLLSSNEISGKIFPRFAQGLIDSDSTLRLQSLKNIPIIVPHITERQLNNELLRHLAKTQVDQDVEIRTWTIIIITQISTLLSTSTSSRASILATAFTKSLKDPILKPRLAALYGLDKTIDLFDVKTVANKILTVIAPALLDKDPLVRSKAKTLFQGYLNKLESEAKAMQDNSKNGHNSEDIDFDEYGKNEEINDAELVKQFMSSVIISSSQEHSQTAEEAVTDSFDDPWDPVGIDSNGASAPSENASLFFEGGAALDKSGGTFGGVAVAVEKSWNDDFEDEDDWGQDDAWEQDVAPEPVINKPTRKLNAVKSPKIKTSILTPRSKIAQNTHAQKVVIKHSISSKINKTPKSESTQDNEDDAWDTAW